MISNHIHMPPKLVLGLLFLLLLGQNVHSYNILIVCPIPGKSLGFICDAFVRNLLGAGHYVTHVTPFPKDDKENLHHVDIGETTFKIFDDYEAIFNLSKALQEPQDLNHYTILEMGLKMMELTMTNQNFNDFIMSRQTFDAVIVDFYESPVLAGLSAVFDCPLIWAYSLGLDWRIAELVGGDFNPTHTSDYLSSSVPPYNLLQRVIESYSRAKTRFYRWRSIESEEKNLYEKYLVPAIKYRNARPPKYDDVIYSGSLVLANTHHAIGGFPSLPLNIKFTGGLHIDDTTEIQEELKNILDESKHGFIYFSMGSTWESKSFPDHLVQKLLQIFGNLKETVIWKYEKYLDSKFYQPENVFTIKWAPQQRILEHPKCVLFITHGGLLSTTEAIHFGVPLIGIPIGFDQKMNIARAVSRGYAVKVDYDHSLPTVLETRINMVIQDDRYKLAVKKLSSIYHDRPITVQKEFIHAVEHVIKTNGAHHLQPSSKNVTWSEQHNLDFWLAIFLVIVYYTTPKNIFKMNFRRKQRSRIHQRKNYTPHFVGFCFLLFYFYFF